MRAGGDVTRPGPRAALALLAALIVGLAGADGASSAPATYRPPACQTVTFHSEPKLYSQRVCMNVGATNHHDPGSYLFLTPHDDGIGVYGDAGTLVWWKEHPAGTTEEHNATIVRFAGRRFLAAWAGTSRRIGHNGVTINTGAVLLYNNHYQRVGEITAGPPFAPSELDMHEFRITPQGDALVGIYQPVKKLVPGGFEYVVHYVVQKLSLVRDSHGIHTGKVLFQWRTQGHVPVSKSYLPDPGAGGAWDFFHGNAISQDTDGNLIVSARNTWGVYKISVRTGRIMWELGGKGDPRLHLPWCYQHDVTALGAGDYSLFDDGSIGPGCYPTATWHPARGLVIHVDGTHTPASVSLVHAYTHRPSIYSEFTGGIQRLPNGDALVNWGYVPEITQYAPDGRVVMDLSLSAQSYRGYRFSWAGAPSSPPLAAAEVSPGGTRVWASWNGSTEVQAWRVLGGVTASGLSVVAAPAHKTGFETSIPLKQAYPLVAVQALSATGKVLATSKPIHPVAGAA